MSQEAKGGQMSTNKIIIIPMIVGSGDLSAALSFGRLAAMERNAILQLLYLTDLELPPAELIANFGLAPEELFNAVVNQVCCGQKDYEKAILEAAARPGVELVVFSDGGKNKQITQTIIDCASCPVLL